MCEFTVRDLDTKEHIIQAERGRKRCGKLVDTPWPCTFSGYSEMRDPTLHFSDILMARGSPSFSAHLTLLEKKAFSTYAERFHKPELEHQLGKNEVRCLTV